MINFASLFSQFRGGSSSPINDLIDQPDTDLDRLLDEDSFVNQYKSGNSKVMSYMKYEKMQSLVNYVTSVGPAQDKKKGYKFPLAACDILSSDNSSTIDFFLPNGPLFVEESVQQQIEIEKQQQIEDQAPKPNEQPENAPKTVIQDQLENEGQVQQQPNQVQKENKENKDGQQKMDIQEPVQVKKKTRLVKRKKTITKVNKKQVQPLMNQLLSYFEGQVNYTLAGYVSKILISFFGKKPVQTMNYILLQPKHFDNILNHVQSRSVGQFIMKIMTHQSTQILPQREQAIQKMLSKLSKNQQIYVISNLSICMSQIIQKVAANAKSTSPIQEFCALYFAPKIVISIINNVISDQQNVSVYNSSILLTYLTNAPIILPENQTMVNQFKALLSSFVQKSIQKLQITKDDRITVGFGRVKIVQILSFIIRENILSARQIVARQAQFFPTFINLIKNYQMNNIIHNQFIKIINITLSQSEESPLLNNLLQGEYLLAFLSEQSEQDQKIRAGSGTQKNRKGYIGHVISICRKIQEFAEKNQKLAILAQKPQFQNIIQNLVNKQVYEYNKNLAGFSLRKGQPQTIMFMKQQVIKQHIKFLTATPPPVYEPEPQNIQHPDLQETHTIDVNEVLKQSDKNKQTRQIQEVLQQDVNPKYWVSHISYEVDDLINDL